MTLEFCIGAESNSVTGVKLTGSDFIVSIRRRTWFGIPLYKVTRVREWNITQRKLTDQTYATLAPDTAKLKPVSFSPFDIPLMLGLNFLNMSVVNSKKDTT